MQEEETVFLRVGRASPPRTGVHPFSAGTAAAGAANASTASSTVTHLQHSSHTANLTLFPSPNKRNTTGTGYHVLVDNHNYNSNSKMTNGATSAAGGSSNSAVNEDDEMAQLTRSIRDATVGPPTAGHNSVMVSVGSMVSISVGAGIVSLPHAVAISGWAAALVYLTVAAVVCAYTAKLLIACKTLAVLAGKGVVRSYDDIGEAAYGKWGRRVTTIMQNFTLGGVTVVYLILLGGQMVTIFDGRWLTDHDWVLIFGVLVLPIVYAKSMKEVGILSTLAALCSACVVTFILVKSVHVSHTRTATDVKPVYDLWAWEGAASGFNVIMFGFGTHAVYPVIEDELKFKSKWPTVANLGFSCGWLLYTAAGMVPYYAFGDILRSDASGNVLTVMNQDSLMVKLANWFLVVQLILVFGLPLMPINKAIGEALGIDKLPPRKELPARIVARTILMAVILFIAVIVPYFLQMIQLVSALSIVSTALLFPPIFYYSLYKQARRARGLSGSGDLLSSGYGRLISPVDARADEYLSSSSVVHQHGDLTAAGTAMMNGGSDDPLLGGPDGVSRIGDAMSSMPLWGTDISKPISIFRKILLLAIIYLGVVACGAGLYYAVLGLRNAFRNDSHPFECFFVPCP